MRILIVEDEPFIAADLEALAVENSHSVVGVADTMALAREMMASLSFDAALVDVKLGDGFTGGEVAALLGKAASPFAFVTGNAEQLPSGAFGAVAIVEKPFTDRQIAETLIALAAACKA